MGPTFQRLGAYRCVGLRFAVALTFGPFKRGPNPKGMLEEACAEVYGPLAPSGSWPRAHGAEWGDFFHRGGAITPGLTERLMAAYLTWRGIPPPRSLESLIQRTLQPHVPPPQPGTYGNAAVARMMARGTRLDSSSYSPRRTTATITTPPPRSRATTATRATNVRARTWAATSSTSPDPSTSAPPNARCRTTPTTRCRRHADYRRSGTI